MVEAEALCYRYRDGEPVLQGVGFRIAAGDKLVLLGSNGCGKTTLLKLLDGLLFPQRGQYRYDGEPVDAARLKDAGFSRRFRREVALLFQNPNTMLFNPTVYDEIAFGVRQLGLEQPDARVRHWAGVLGVARHLDSPPFRLSGGEKQKVCLASLLALEPKLLLLDEPAANLDPRSTGWLVDFLQSLPTTTLVTTHNLSLAPELGARALVLSEAHELIYDGAVEPLLSDKDTLLRANLVHAHRHRHAGLEHRHFHVHDWD
jgi:cobalt/nickel transport system ATP-binding protein